MFREEKKEKEKTGTKITHNNNHFKDTHIYTTLKLAIESTGSGGSGSFG